MNKENPQEYEKIKETKTEELIEKLKSFDIPVEEWGKGSAKTIEHLLDEIEEGETVLVEENGELLRQVSFIGIEVFFRDKNGLHKLREQKQVFKDGRTRTRPELTSSLSEKMKPGEEPQETAVRCLKEELKKDIDPELIDFLEEKDITKESPSYPGLKTRYKNYGFKLMLPAEFFDREGYTGEEADHTSYWQWEKQEENEK